MITTLITQSNSASFLPVVSDEALYDCDLFIGAIDETKDMAVGVLGVEAVYDHSLAIRYIYVDEDYRRMGAGTALLKRLKDVASKMDAASLICTHINSSESNGVYELLSSAGFEEDLDSVPVYSADLADIEVRGVKSKYRIIQLKSLYSEEWADFIKDWSMGSIKNPEGDTADIFERGFYDPLHSYMAYSGSLLVGELLSVKTPDGYWISHFGARGDDANAIMYELIVKAVSYARENLDEGTQITICTDSSKMLNIFNNLTRDRSIKTGESVTQFYDMNR